MKPAFKVFIGIIVLFAMGWLFVSSEPNDVALSQTDVQASGNVISSKPVTPSISPAVRAGTPRASRRRPLAADRDALPR